MGRIWGGSECVSRMCTVRRISRSCVDSAPGGGSNTALTSMCAKPMTKHWMHEAADRRIAVVMNPAAFTHYSYALADAAHMVLDADLPLMEVHISNPAARDEFRKRSVISPVATGTITGLGYLGYKLALEAIAELTKS